MKSSAGKSSKNIKLELNFRDRVGLIADMSTRIAEYGFNILSIEVIRKDIEAHVFVEITNRDPIASREELFQRLGRIPDLRGIQAIDTLPQEARENLFRVVLDNIRDGVISIDRDTRVTTINRVARNALNCTDENIIGKSIKTLAFRDDSLIDCLEGKRFTNVKKDITINTDRLHYFATGRPIQDSQNRIIGAVGIYKDMSEIKMLAQSITQPTQISFSDIIGNDPTIQGAVQFARKIASTDAIVSIRGDSGTGKELVAHAIHTASGRQGPFVPINCAALPEQLLESELFGYVGGAFTGSLREGKPGLFEIAAGGTVFLDEIAEMPSGSQAKILRLIQEKCVRRIGGAKEIPVNARIITATNKNLERMVEENRFRQDLYYRINVLPLHIPPLRERKSDIPLLTGHFLFLLGSRMGKIPPALTPAALEKLLSHHWPGNVRELKNVVERAAILSEGDAIDVDAILFSHEIERSIRDSMSHPPKPKPCGQSLKQLVGDYEKQIIVDLLKTAGSIRQAARTLQLSHTALLNKLKKYGILVEIHQTVEMDSDRPSFQK
ncbi:sigma 54-interacting transcriptional regulator [Desulfococcus sp.]|uniref:sigma 54-interacting transcriptional regulator n=1 Tax=Desulfococcus sp. TaxID=2025834 RepID=UPI0035932EFF